jgi:hypothetical protein
VTENPGKNFRPTAQDWKAVITISAIGLVLLYTLMISSVWWSVRGTSATDWFWILTLPPTAIGWQCGMLYAASLASVRRRLALLVLLAVAFAAVMFAWRWSLAGW